MRGRHTIPENWRNRYAVPVSPPSPCLTHSPFRSLLADPGHRTMRTSLVMLILCLPLWVGEAQTATAPYQLSGGFSALSNSFNGVPGSRQPLLGWEVNAVLAAWHNLRFVLDYANYQGTNLGSPQHGHFATAGSQYSHRIGRESIFGKMLFGEGWLNKNWAANGAAGTLASFTIRRGGIDTPLARHFSLRVDGGVEHTNFALKINSTSLFPLQNSRSPEQFRASLRGHRMGSPSGFARGRSDTAIDHTTGAARI